MDMGADVKIVNRDDVHAVPPSDADISIDQAATAPNGTRHDTSNEDKSTVKLESDNGTPARNGDESIATQRPAKRRKLDDTTPRRSASRAASPPWKSFLAEGPTTIITDNGIRKSGRVNSQAPPPQTPEPATRNPRNAVKSAQTNGGAKNSARQPNSRAASGAGNMAKTRSTGTNVRKPPATQSSPPTRKSERQRRPSTAVAAGLSSPAVPPTPEIARNRPGRPRKQPQPSASDATDNLYSTPKQSFDPNPDGSAPRLRIRLRKPDPPSRHPHHAPPAPKFATFDDWLRNDDPLEGEESQKITQDKAEEEAQRRLRIVEAAERGVLSQAQCSIYLPDPAEEPPPHYGHWDHVVSHALKFNKLLKDEQMRHRKNAKLLAREAFDYWKEKYKTKSREEIEQEERDRVLLRYKQLVKDLKDAWANVRLEVDKERFARWEEEQVRLGHKAMDHMFDKAREVLGRGIVDSASSMVSEDRESEGEEDSENGSSANSDEENDEFMSSSAESDSDHGSADEDANLTAEQLREKYGQLPDVIHASSDEGGESDAESEDTDHSVDRTPEPTPDPDIEMEDSGAPHDAQANGFHSGEDGRPDDIDPATVELEEVDDILLDSDEGESIKSESGSEEWSSDAETDQEEQSDSGSEGGDDLGVMGFLTPAEIKKLKEAQAANVHADEEGIASEGSPAVEADVDKPREDRTADIIVDDVADVDEAPDEQAGNMSTKPKPSVNKPDTETPEKLALEKTVSRSRSRHTSSPPRTEIPSLLRGTLREYQHDGLDWLVNRYDSDSNGAILADEMGLGKTIQTIALLAYIAVNRGKWGPHLVVVPTSVMLNWEMEFKKWCPGFKILTYYGDINERKRKRIGWRSAGRDMYNVVITSYQLVLQDAAAFKQRSWQYLILDEAHNIKNFKSQRWQTMLTLRTERRLLLTGTPLQNNVDELWSLLYFTMPGDGRIAGFEEFMMALKNPTTQILEQGRQQLDEQGQKLVKKMHEVLRPYLLRRLKADVEKQMPAKYEHVVYCKLSKRQRQLYDGFMGRASTKQILASGNYMSIINCLMSLRKVCNHPDLFETRSIVTSMAMRKSVPGAYEIKDLLIRKRLQEKMDEEVNLDALNLVFAHRERMSMLHARRAQQIRATRPLEDLVERQTRRLNTPVTPSPSVIESALASFERRANIAVKDHLESCLRLTRTRTQFLPIYGKGLIDLVTEDYQDFKFGAYEHGYTVRAIEATQSKGQSHHQTMPSMIQQVVTRPSKKLRYGFRSPRSPRQAGQWNFNQISWFKSLIPSLEERAESLEQTITQFTCVTPAVYAEDIAKFTVSQPVIDRVRSSTIVRTRDPFHEPRIRQSIAFPDKRLLQYDCGKLQRLAVLLRTLQAGGHRALIFTQMTKVLDILEQFLNIHGHRYLRLDGATKVEQRQILTDRFNNDPRIFCFILSSRSGGLGINLTGADTVIFYDLDWNPAMDKQCQDRSHRIGQTREVHIYKFVSEYTIEANILRKSNQKRLLDDVIIQKGDFTTDYFNKVSWRDALEGEEPVDEAGAAMDRVLGEKAGLLGDAKVMRSVEDTEDQNAANVAQKEIVDEIHDDQVDFSESSAPTPAISTTRNASETVGDVTAGKPRDDTERRHVDEYMLDWYREEYGKEPYKPPTDRQRRKSKKGQDPHRTRKKKVY